MSDSVICFPWSDYLRSFLEKKMSTKYPSMHSFTVLFFLVMKFSESAGNSAHTTITVCFPQNNYHMI